MPPAARGTASSALLAAVACGGSVPIATFDGAAATTRRWEVVNDPVMGGQSFSSFHVNDTQGLGVWSGQVRVVPFLGAPGFCNLQSPGLGRTADFPDLSPASGIGVRAREANSSGLLHFSVMIMSKGARRLMQRGVYTANVTFSSETQEAFAPWSAFVCTWRGQMVPWCPPLLTQLDKVDSVGLGTAFPGTAGDFQLVLESIYGARTSTSFVDSSTDRAIADFVDLATFDGKAPRKWHSENDPVMGGQSDSTVQVAKSFADFKGSTRIVPSLQAPGFTIALTEGPLLSRFPDVSAMDGLAVSVSNMGAPYSGFKIAFCDSHLFFRCQFQSFKAALPVPAAASRGFQEVFVPWKEFSNRWNASTGEHTAESPPGPSSLRSITQLQLWAEGVEGDFDLRFSYVRAVRAPVRPAAAALLV
ncbi:unnamed protein product [Prorocentrum cordatum]|uniref:NADH:ubiquinone oxidoreductase intermediate-associated protein 30 domain-containing protein n=1 Tax=Prorocentrum cordatum TaxID=2364126 RepID=A0ABN9WBD6_9DINO|nr:unnamed protein product [Polarella glacialis]